MESIDHQRRPTYALSRWLFLRALGAVSLIAFVSLWGQIEGLIGSAGISPAAPYLEAVHEQLGREAYHRLPTLCWWRCDDAMLRGLCAAGLALSGLLIVGVCPRLMLLALWGVSLSISVAGQQFLSFQWDTLLLETLFCAVWFAPLTLWPGITRGGDPSRLSRWLMWLLLFKLMFLSGVTKLLSGDVLWREGTALTVHYQTQPIPNALSWTAHHAPLWWHELECWAMFAVELGAPLLIFGMRWMRHLAFVLLVGLQVAIEATGNYGFFNLLTLVLCLPLLDDRLLRRFVPRRWTASLDDPAGPPEEPPWWQKEGPLRRFLRCVPPLLILGVGLLVFTREMVRSQNTSSLPAPVVRSLSAAERLLLSWGEPYVLDPLQPFRTINGYGLFRVMTAERPEIVIEGSHDGLEWREYAFSYKPGDVQRAPPMVAPHMPRLDWQMWFAALNPRGNEGWLSNLCQRLLEGEPQVLELLENAPFPDGPPRYVRLVYYRYEFTTPEERAETGAWWKRTRLGNLTQPLSLRR